ncbi:hypothetical protein [Methanoplanus limicola]|uniref:Uncharacterized protein n=1 Tax=Methanoplanus limicola DSM 2279 TaxID=937775 RepID=H1Z357_9EURY|nr:hypothetical protein [Methanoplanus limicola]EHQ35597.1 hypothetical protein Metlim_1494 [Methanoplanus limicola DSM 2279]
MVQRTYPGRCLISGSDTTKRKAESEIILSLNKYRREESEPVSWLILFTGFRNPKFWLYLLVDRNSTLKDIDQKLRDVWLECCGHLSSFYIAGKEYESDPSEDLEYGKGLDMADVTVDKLLTVNLTGKHVYDNGSPTTLYFKVICELPYRTKEGRKTEIVARNKRPEIFCSKCGRPATYIFRLYEDQDDIFYCDKCHIKHKSGDDAWLLAANSPRSGVCGYEGGLADDEC